MADLTLLRQLWGELGGVLQADQAGPGTARDSALRKLWGELGQVLEDADMVKAATVIDAETARKAGEPVVSADDDPPTG